MALLAGFGSIAIPGPRGGFWVYIVGPLLGGLVGGLIYERLVRPLLARKVPPGVEEAD